MAVSDLMVDVVLRGPFWDPVEVSAISEPLALTEFDAVPQGTVKVIRLPSETVLTLEQVLTDDAVVGGEPDAVPEFVIALAVVSEPITDWPVGPELLDKDVDSERIGADVEPQAMDVTSLSPTIVVTVAQILVIEPSFEVDSASVDLGTDAEPLGTEVEPPPERDSLVTPETVGDTGALAIVEPQGRAMVLVTA